MKANRIFMLRALQEGIIVYAEDTEIRAIAYGFTYNREQIELADIIPRNSDLSKEIYAFFLSQAGARGYESLHVADAAKTSLL